MSLSLDGLLAQTERGVKRYGTTFGDQPALLFNANSYGNPRALFQSENRGRLDAQPPGMARNQFNMEYGFGNVPPNPYAPIVGENELSVNPRITPFGRQYKSLAHFLSNMRNTPAPGRHHLAAMFRVSVDSRRRNVGLHLQSYTESDSGMAEATSVLTADATPTIAASPAVLNAVLAALQLDLLKQQKPANADAYKNSDYAKLTPFDLWFGPPSSEAKERCYGGAEYAPKSLTPIIPQFQGFAWDGVVLQEEAYEGASTSMHEGRRMLPGGQLSMASGDGPPIKLVTVTHAGQTPMYDYFNRAGVVEGATLFGILRKFPRTASGPLRYNLVQKPDDVMYTSEKGGQERIVEIGGDDDITVATVGGGQRKVGAQPYEWGFYANPTGDRWVPPEYTTYTDEWGRTRHDALVVYFGRVVHRPVNSVYRPPPPPSQFSALRNMTTSLGAPQMQVNLSGASALLLVN